MGFGEQFSEARLVLGRPVERLHELLPLRVIENESGLVGERFFGLLTGGAYDEVGDVDAPPLGRNFDPCWTDQSCLGAC